MSDNNKNDDVSLFGWGVISRKRKKRFAPSFGNRYGKTTSDYSGAGRPRFTRTRTAFGIF